MRARDLTIAMGFSALALAASQVHAQGLQHCAPREAVMERLAEKYKESRQSVGIGGNNSLVEVFASEDSGSWTITVTLATGVTCLLASGNSFETLAEVLPPDGSDA